MSGSLSRSASGKPVEIYYKRTPLLCKEVASLPQGRASQDTKDPRRRMREGRAPLLETIREAYPPTVLTGSEELQP